MHGKAAVLPRALASVAIGLLALAPLSTAQAAGAGSALKQVAQQQAATTGTTFESSSIRKVIGDFATVGFTPVGGGEEQIVILRKNDQSPNWRAVAGPSTTFVPSVMGALPSGLLNKSSYLSLRLQSSVDGSVPTRQFAAGGMRFNYPADAMIDARQGGASVVGTGYRLVVTPVGVVNTAFDEWSYDTVVDSQAERYRSSAPGVVSEPQAMTVYTVNGRTLLETNWDNGTTRWHEFTTESNGVGYRVLVDAQDETAGFQAVALVLKSIESSGSVTNSPAVARIAVAG